MTKRELHRIAVRLRKALEDLPDRTEISIRSLAEICYPELVDSNTDIIDKLGLEGNIGLFKLARAFAEKLDYNTYFLDCSAFAYMYVGFDPKEILRRFNTLIEESSCWPITQIKDENISIDKGIVLQKDFSPYDWTRKYLITLPPNTSIKFEFMLNQALFFWPVIGHVSYHFNSYSSFQIDERPARLRKIIEKKVIGRGEHFSHRCKYEHRYTDSLIIQNTSETEAKIYLVIRN